jgi:diguanylate cyclase (GGDEF)-like protein
MAFWTGARQGPGSATTHSTDGLEVERRRFRRPNEDALKSTEAAALLRAYEEAGLGWFWSTDVDGRLTYLTPSFAALLGVSVKDRAQLTALLRRTDDNVEDGRTLPLLLNRHAPFDKLVVSSASKRLERHWALSGTPRYDRSGTFLGFVGSGVDVTDQRESARQADRLAMFDGLTGLPNRLRFDGRLRQVLRHAAHAGTVCAVLQIDLDRFKQVNDTLGHPAGDTLLKQVAQRLAVAVGETEDVFRVGGDEFQVILPECNDREVARNIGERIISSLSQPYLIGGSRCIIGASVGIALAPSDGDSGQELVQKADLALYAAKQAGRGRTAFFTSDLLRSAADKRALEGDLRDAIARGELHVFYQPIVNSSTQYTTGVEALVRWHHPERGMISPALFIPIAEDAGLIGALGEWVLRKACEDAASWPGRLRVAVNVSPLQVTEGALPGIVLSALAHSGLCPSRLELEITEGVFLSDSAAADSVLASLKEIGVRLALDDFGTGYSSLGYLRTAPFDKIKIDQSFVRSATLPGSRNAAIIAAIVALASALGMETTAEGIESHDQLDLIRRLRVSHVQGFIYSQAVSTDELQTQLAAGDWRIAPAGPSMQRSERVSMYRRAKAIFGNHQRPILIRNLSETGALIEGLDDIPFDSRVIIDLGEGQLAFAKVLRSRNRQQGVVFEEALVSDADGSLRTRKAVSPYLLRTSGIFGLPEATNAFALAAENTEALDAYAAKLGLVSSPVGSSAVSRSSGAAKACGGVLDRLPPTLAEIGERSRSMLFGSDWETSLAWSAFNEHFVPAFGHLRPDGLAPSVLGSWLQSKAERDDLDSETIAQLQVVLAKLYVQAVQQAAGSGLGTGTADSEAVDARDVHERPLSTAEIERLMRAAEASPNAQLKFIVALLMLTRVRQRDLLEAQWSQVDFGQKVLVLPGLNGGANRRVPLSQSACDLLMSLPKWPGCSYIIANPATHKPYRSFAISWDTARKKAELADVEIDDLRHCRNSEHLLVGLAGSSTACPDPAPR